MRRFFSSAGLNNAPQLNCFSHTIHMHLKRGTQFALTGDKKFLQTQVHIPSRHGVKLNYRIGRSLHRKGLAGTGNGHDKYPNRGTFNFFRGVSWQ
jgi:hypothetical protein